jgi:hypothetical protein
MDSERTASLGRTLSAMTTFVLAFCGLVGNAWLAPPQAVACSSETEEIRQSEVYALRLPDCRSYEQVSPVDKNATDAAGKPGYVQSSPTGDSVTYYSVVPFPESVNASEFPTYLGRRKDDTWSTQSLLPSANPGASTEVVGVTDDNGESVVAVGSEEEPLLKEEEPSLNLRATVGQSNFYVRDNATGGYRLLAPGNGALAYETSMAGHSRILFTSTLKELLPGIVDKAGAPYLYEWNNESRKISFVGFVNGKAPEGGTVAGSNEREGRETYAQGSLSEDGVRIFFSELSGNKQIYVREPEANRTLTVSPGPAQWWTSTPNSSEAFYTEGGNLYAFGVESSIRKAITSGAARVIGVLGASEQGSYVYFIAEGVLPGENEELAKNGADNLYEWHEGDGVTGIRLITRLTEEDETDWRGFFRSEPSAAAQGEKSSRISSDGQDVLFSSTTNLTSYNNKGNDELYLYEATAPVSTNNPKCVSCNPMNQAATSSAFLTHNVLGASPVPRNAFMTRNLSADGDQVFFQTEEALVPGTSNHQMNVYEWEREGAGSCADGTGNESGGCLYLISTGQSTSESYFGDASADGSNVYFFTRQPLVGQDKDNNVDIYDARENGGIANQNAGAPSPCIGEACRSASESLPSFNLPSSVIFSGSGNVLPQSEALHSRPKIARSKHARRGKHKKRKYGRQLGKHSVRRRR